MVDGYTQTIYYLPHSFDHPKPSTINWFNEVTLRNAE